MDRLIRLVQRLVPVAAAGLIALGVAGCAGRPVRDVLIDQHAAAYVFHHPREEVLAALQRMLEQRGFEVLPLSRGEALVTEWMLLTGTERIATAYEKLFVVVRRLTPEHSRVTALRMQLSTVGMETYHPTVQAHEDGDGGKTSASRQVNDGNYPLQWGKPYVRRALDVEWALIRRLDPARARQIETAVKRQLGKERPQSM